MCLKGKALYGSVFPSLTQSVTKDFFFTVFSSAFTSQEPYSIQSVTQGVRSLQCFLGIQVESLTQFRTSTLSETIFFRQCYMSIFSLKRCLMSVTQEFLPFFCIYKSKAFFNSELQHCPKHFFRQFYMSVFSLRRCVMSLTQEFLQFFFCL